MNRNYNPDVLTCLANLSNDEVFTPPQLANQMLDMLPQELFRCPKTKFLDPCTKSGVFLREIAKRLIDGLADSIPDLQKRIDHIMHYQLYGLAITELTALMSRRSLYCSKNASCKYSISHFADADGNVRFERISHTWAANGRCRYCGASQEVYDRGEELESHAYQFIHTNNPNELYNNMTFDVIIGNPPYQLSDGGGTGDSATPLYHLFIEQAKKLQPVYICMIVPSRWMKGGKGLSSFREKMIRDTRLKVIYDFENAKECFSGLHIDGGICYFLWDKSYNGMIEYHYQASDGSTSTSNRFLKTDFSETVIRDVRQVSIIEKTSRRMTKKFSTIVSTRNPYGFGADFFNCPERYPDIETYDVPIGNDECLIYGVKGKKGGAKRTSCYINKRHINKLIKSIGKYKLFFSKAYMTTSTVPPEIIVGVPNTICTETFILIGIFESEQDALNCLSYIKTKFFRALLFYNRHSLNISRDSFDLIPLQDFSKPWTDEELYAKYGLTDDEIAFIESMIRPMD